MHIRKIYPEDIPAISAIHLLSFPKDHITSHFSKEMLAIFLRNLISFETYNFVVTDSHNLIIGYIIAGYNYRKALIQFIKKHYMAIIKVLLFSPSFIPEKIKNLISKRPNYILPGVCLDMIAVSPLVTNQGVGSNLLEYFEKMLLGDNIREYFLYVKKNNESAVSFYRKRGFLISGTSGNSLIMKKRISHETGKLLK